MELVVIGFIIIIVLLFIGKKKDDVSIDREREVVIEKPFDHIEIPILLGMRENVFHENNVNKIEGAIDHKLKDKIKLLFYRDPKNANVSEHEFELRFFELKRYFLMCSLLRDVPMFSDGVDEVWHTLILSTRDYQKVCDDFMGTFLHHSPATSKSPNPHGRAWFDLLYTELFEFTHFSGVTWGGFFQHPLSHSQVEELRNAPVSELKSKYFRPGANEELVEALIHSLRTKVNIAFEKGSSSNVNPFVPNETVPMLQRTPFFSQAMIFYSMVHGDEYSSKMIEIQIEFDNQTSSYACGSGNTDS